MTTQRMEIRVPFATLLKIALAVLLVAIVIKLWPVILGVVIAVLLAVMLDPLAGWMQRHRVRRGIAITVIAFLLFGSLVFLLAVVVPLTVQQFAELAHDLPRIKQRVTTQFPSIAPLLQNVQQPKVPDRSHMRVLMMRGLMAGKFAFEGLTAIIFVFVVTIYLLVEGRVAYQWLVTFAEPPQRPKWDRTARDIGGEILAYMRGQVITCFLCGGWAYLVLLLCHVPASLPLAVLAFVADLVPVVGTIVMTVPAVLIALTVSPLKALIVFGGYLLYHFVESYFIIPRVYGDQMRLSTLAVLLAVAVGGTLQGPLGAVLILPFAAAYPIVERIWLRDRLPKDAVEKHEELAEGES